MCMLKQANYVYAETHLSIHTSASVYAKAYTAYTVAPPLLSLEMMELDAGKRYPKLSLDSRKINSLNRNPSRLTYSLNLKKHLSRSST